MELASLASGSENPGTRGKAWRTGWRPAALLLVFALWTAAAAAQDMEIVALETVSATLLSVEDNLARIDKGLTAGIRPGDIAEIYYLASRRRVVVNRGEVIELDEFTAVLEVEPEFMILPGYSADFEIPRNRISPLGIVDLARSRLEARTTVSDLRALIDRLVPEDAFIEQEFMRLIEERRKRRGEAVATAQPPPPPPAPPEPPPADRGATPRGTPPRGAPPREAPQFSYEGEYHEPEILAMIQAWAEAWATQDVDAYLAFYSQAFRPSRGLSRGAWAAQRRQRLTGPRFIELSLVFEEARSVGVGQGWARFRQAYRSDTYRDAVTKRLELVWEDQDWKIAQEIVEN